MINWPDRSQNWVGDPVAFLSCQVGYPDTRGSVQWAAHVFQSTDTGDTTTWSPAMEKKSEADVVNAPNGWTSDKTFVKRMVHFTEPPGPLESPENQVFIERNVIDLDPGDTGTLTATNTLEVRADSVGVLEVGPISLNIALEGPNQVVEVEFQARGQTYDGQSRPIVRFAWNGQDQDRPRRWKIFTGDPNFLADYRYRVRVIVKGSIFTKGMEWIGPWQDGAGNGPLTVSVPTPESEGVTRRALVDEGERSASGAMPPPPATGVAAESTSGPPPSVRSGVSGSATVGGYALTSAGSESRAATGGGAVPPPPARRGNRSSEPTSPPRAAGTLVSSTATRAEAEGLSGLELAAGWSSVAPRRSK